MLLIIIVAVVLVFVLGRCKVDCKKDKKEGYQRSELGQRNNSRYGRSPVDFYVLSDTKDNPHFKANPQSKFQPLENGPDLYFEQRKLGDDWYKLQEQYQNTWRGSKHPAVSAEADGATRYHTVSMGDVGIAMQLRDMSADGKLEPVIPQNTNMVDKLYLGESLLSRHGLDTAKSVWPGSN